MQLKMQSKKKFPVDGDTIRSGAKKNHCILCWGDKNNMVKRIHYNVTMYMPHGYKIMIRCYNEFWVGEINIVENEPLFRVMRYNDSSEDYTWNKKIARAVSEAFERYNLSPPSFLKGILFFGLAKAQEQIIDIFELQEIQSLKETPSRTIKPLKRNTCPVNGSLKGITDHVNGPLKETACKVFQAEKNTFNAIANKLDAVIRDMTNLSNNQEKLFKSFDNPIKYLKVEPEDIDMDSLFIDELNKDISYPESDIEMLHLEFTDKEFMDQLSEDILCDLSLNNNTLY
jgi:hypothetical protein